ncbi:MAG: hypothetical protein RR936_06860 [Carnobacterium sp.]|uniref:hypothetical protein n=1 Tax=Carnobacterium sp. TaxID=48221 RepID=UPI002FCA4899
MDEKNYTHKIVMFDVNSAKRVAYFESEENLDKAFLNACQMPIPLFGDDEGTTFNLNNIVQMNSVEEIKE